MRYVLFILLIFIPFIARTHVDTMVHLNITSTPAEYDSIVASWKAEHINETFTNYQQDYITLDTSRYLPAVSTITDSICKARLKAIPSPIHLPYNDIVKKHLIAYTTTHKALTRRMLTYAKFYFPMIEQELAKNGLPLELKFVPVVESALNPAAASPSGAVGLWQFMLPTGRRYGLEISSLVDDRCDPTQSTRAACLYMNDLYKIYHDWTLVLASYNYGPGNLNKALQRAGAQASTYWDIYPFLPKATRDYIPAMVALTYLYYYHWDYGIVATESPLPLATDTVMVTRHTDLNRVSQALELPIELIRLLNPQYKKDVIPATLKSYPLILPQQEVSRFIACAPTLQIQNDADERLKIGESTTTSSTSTSSGGASGDDYSAPAEPVVYRVKSGDTLGEIARKHGITLSQLMKSNNLRSSKLKIGQTLKIIQ